ncbi:hypothetical protein N658DRAFT_500168 [Parathielavia hyrcaniae]|uniref:DUF7735 domain-containing protein n=1 Tax=Parathielavia hyrcaniae TaxID=113614 RepID=A0AAN6PYC7_9PEZI|nr:hypothetical protein N658DRAFT_500168 [Parathielavia hyrcaniae]
MKSATLIAALSTFVVTALTTSADYTQLYPIVAPTAYPGHVTETTDPWRGATEDVMQYLSVPSPTGELSEAQISFGSGLIQTCLTSGTYAYPCAYPDQSLW